MAAASWSRVLQVSDNTGISDVVLNPSNPDELYASSYQRRRHVGLQIAGGPEGAIYKSVDAGRTWRKLEKGLPTGDVGRIGLALSPHDPAVVYALIAAAGQNGGFFRSADRGENWVRQSNFVPTDPQYYMELYPDPKQPGRIYTLDVPFRITNDEGKTWGTVGGGGVHVDHHAVAFDPHDPEHILLGNDGGLYQTFDAGRTWEWFDNLPAAQFYRVDVDNDLPFYNVYGGLQDNGSLMSPIRTLSSQGVLNHNWESIGGGDGMQPRAEPGNPQIVYVQSQNGSISRLNRRTGESVSIRPRVAQGEPPLRFYWDAPLIVSSHAPTRVYFAAQKLFRTNDRGASWTAISGDLTRAINRDTLPVMGRTWGPEAVGRNLFTSDYGTIVALEESPLQAGLLYVGTDDGLIQISEDDGRNWRRAAPLPGVPELAYINDLAASRHDANVVYAVAQNYLRGDFQPYVFRSSDRGRSWTAVRGDLPARHVAWSIVEDHENRNLLFLGTEFGLFFTGDGGTRWSQLKGGLPTIMVRDLAIQRRENDLIAGTFGRGIFVLDDYTPLRRITPQVLAEEAVLFPVRDALAFTQRRLLPGATGSALFSADNPPYGALITYYARSAGPLVLQIKDASNALMTELPANAAGLQRIAWDLRMQVRDTAIAAGRGRAAGEGGEGGGRGGGGRGGGPQTRPVPPGIDTAQLGRKSNNTFTAVGQPQRITVKALFPAEELGSR